MNVLAIDPGVTGAIAQLRPGWAEPNIIDLPTAKRETGRTRIHGANLLRELEALLTPGEQTIIGVEYIHAMPISGSVGVFSQGNVTGTIEGILDVLQDGRPYIETRSVQPSAWKKHFGLIKKSKEDARQKASVIFGQPEFLQRKKDHNRAEAALIALFLRDQLAYTRNESLDQESRNG